MNRSDRIYVTNGWVLFGGELTVALDSISAIYVDTDDEEFSLRVERRERDGVLFVFRGTKQECRNRLRQFQRQITQ